MWHKAILRLSILIFTGIFSVLGCANEQDVNEFLTDQLQHFSLAEENETMHGTVGIVLQRMNLAPDLSYLQIIAQTVIRWDDERCAFNALDPCHGSIDVKNSTLLPVTLRGYSEEDFHLVNQFATIYRNGSFLLSQKFEVNAPCVSYSMAFPFGSILCTVILQSSKHTMDQFSIDWDPGVISHPFITSRPIENVGDYKLKYRTFQHVDADKAVDGLEKLVMELQFNPELNKIVFLFYLPSMLIIFICWLSMLLGPMAITRALMNIGAFIMLFLHYSLNMADLPHTARISAIDVWKVATMLFVMGSFFELVLVSCMASLGRSRRLTKCCRRGHSRKGRYDVEPVYEELNDMRHRQTRITCSCCRYSALTVDALSLLIFAAAFVLFTLVYFNKFEPIVSFLNGLDPEYYIPNI